MITNEKPVYCFNLFNFDNTDLVKICYYKSLGGGGLANYKGPNYTKDNTSRINIPSGIPDFKEFVKRRFHEGQESEQGRFPRGRRHCRLWVEGPSNLPESYPEQIHFTLHAFLVGRRSSSEGCWSDLELRHWSPSSDSPP